MLGVTFAAYHLTWQAREMHEIQVTALNGGYASASGVCAPRCAFEPLRLRYQWAQRSGVRGVGLRPAEHISLDEQAEGVTLAFVGEVKAKPAHRRSSAPALPQPASSPAPRTARPAQARSTTEGRPQAARIPALSGLWRRVTVAGATLGVPAHLPVRVSLATACLAAL